MSKAADVQCLVPAILHSIKRAFGFVKECMLSSSPRQLQHYAEVLGGQMNEAINRRDWINRLNNAHKHLSNAQQILDAHAVRGKDKALTGQDTDDAYWQGYGEKLKAVEVHQRELETIYRERHPLPPSS